MPGRQLGEGLVGRSKHGERPLTLQGLGQTGRLDCRDQGIERAGRLGRIDDVAVLTGAGHCGKAQQRRGRNGAEERVEAHEYPR